MIESLFFGLLTGFALGLTGGGGSVFAVPLLVYGLGIPLHEAVVISLAAVGATALGGGLARLRDGQAEPYTATLFGLSGIIGAPLGAWLHPRFPEAVLLPYFCAVDAGSRDANVAAGQSSTGRNSPHPRQLRSGS